MAKNLDELSSSILWKTELATDGPQHLDEEIPKKMLMAWSGFSLFPIVKYKRKKIN